MPASPRRRRLLFLLGFFVLGGIFCQGLFWHLTLFDKPETEVPQAGRPEFDGPRSRLGGSVLERREGYWFFSHRGEPVRVGMEHAVLGQFLTRRVEHAMHRDLGERLPAPLRMIVPAVLLWQYRHMDDHIAPSLKEEVWGFASTYEDPTPFPIDAYQRGLYYHALHDITQELVGNPWVDPAVAGACTAFAASGPATTDGHLLVGRNFDFEVFPLFDSDKVVHLFAADGAIPVLSVSWMAMSGVVTGLNAEGIWMSLNTARSEGTNRRGPPVSLWVREILEKARSIDDVERLLGERAPMVSDIYLVADGKTGESAVIERGQTRSARRDAEDHRITASNHLLTEAFAGDEEDASLRAWSTTVSRHLRMEELVAEGGIDPARAQAILRDRRGPGGRELAPGNRNAIDALIATHSVVADLTDRVLWVSTAPHTQGPYRAIDLFAEMEAAGIDTAPYRAGLPADARAWERSAEPAPDAVGEESPSEVVVSAAPSDLPEDPFSASGAYDRLDAARSFLQDADEYLGADAPEEALVMALRAESLVPSADAAWYRAVAHRDAGREADAEAAFADYFARMPSFGPKWREATEWFEARGGAPVGDRPDLP